MYIVLPSHLFYRILYPPLSTLLPLMFVIICVCQLFNKDCMIWWNIDCHIFTAHGVYFTCQPQHKNDSHHCSTFIAYKSRKYILRTIYNIKTNRNTTTWNDNKKLSYREEHSASVLFRWSTLSYLLGENLLMANQPLSRNGRSESYRAGRFHWRLG